jgi:hypothetical protein
MQILPNAKSQFIDANGLPLASGTVGFYFPGTLNPKPTYQDAAGTIANTNPVTLDSRGQALIWGSGVYRQIVKDASGVTIWDQVTEDSNAGLMGNLTDNTFVSGTDFTPGVTTQLTLTAAAGAISNTWIFFDGFYQTDSNVASLNGTTLTFTSAIPVGVGVVTVKIGTTVAVGIPGAGTITDSSVASNAAIKSSKLSYLQGSAGSVTRTIQNRLQDIVSLGDFGVTPASSASAITTALNAAAIAMSISGGTVYIPAGTWRIDGTVTAYPNVEFVGAGKFSTILVPTTINMTLFSMVNAALTIACCAFRDMTIAPSVSGVTGIKLTLARFTDITGINFIGCSQNFVIDRGYFHTIRDILSEGSSTLAAGGATLTSTVDTDYVFHATISNYMLVNQGTGAPSVGLYLRRAIDFELTDVHAYGATGCDVLIIENDSQAVKVKGLNIDGCAAGIILQQGAGVAVVPTFTSIANSHVDQPTAFGIQLNGASETTLTDVMVTPNGANVNIPALFLVNSQKTIINGCIFSGFSATGGAGIQFSGSDQTIIDNCIFLGCNVGIGFSGSPTNVVVGSSNSYPSTTNPLGGAPAGAGNRIQPNQNGLNPGSYVTPVPSFPASGVSFTNATAFSCRVFISGGSFTAVNLAGVSMSASGSWFGEVQPGESISVTYSSVPAWSWVGK